MGTHTLGSARGDEQTEEAYESNVSTPFHQKYEHYWLSDLFKSMTIVT